MLVWISLPQLRALRRRGASSIIATAIFSRASGERSSWLALASSDWVRAQQRLDARRGAVEAGAHAPPPRRGRLRPRAGAARRRRRPRRRCFSASSRRVSRRTTGQAPAAMAAKMHQQQHRQARRRRAASAPATSGRRRAAGQRRRAHAALARAAGPPRPACRRAADASAGAHDPQRAAVAQHDRLAHGAAAAVGFAALEGSRGGDALARRIVQRQRQAQPLRPVAQRRGLLVGRRVGAGQRALEQVAPGRGALGAQPSAQLLALLARGGAAPASPRPARTAAAPPPPSGRCAGTASACAGSGRRCRACLARPASWRTRSRRRAR